jgi:CheY-like chemotaxis protein
MNLLYVEDDPALRYSIARELRDRGHTVHEAESAEKALVLLAEYETCLSPTLDCRARRGKSSRRTLGPQDRISGLFSLPG